MESCGEKGLGDVTGKEASNERKRGHFDVFSLFWPCLDGVWIWMYHDIILVMFDLYLPLLKHP